MLFLGSSCYKHAWKSRASVIINFVIIQFKMKLSMNFNAIYTSPCVLVQIRSDDFLPECWGYRQSAQPKWKLNVFVCTTIQVVGWDVTVCHGQEQMVQKTTYIF